MEIIKTAVDWAKDEVFSSLFFILFGIIFIATCIGFWQLGKTEVAKSFVVPTLVMGILLLTVGTGIFFTNKSRTKSFVTAHREDPKSFVDSELMRTEKSLAEYRTIVFKVIPIMIAIAAVLIVFIHKPVWRASCISTIVFLAIIIGIDSNANARIETYHQQLLKEKTLE